MKKLAICLLPLLASGLLACGGEEKPTAPAAPPGGAVEKPAVPEAPAEEMKTPAAEEPAEQAPAAPSIEDQALALLDRAGKAVAGENWDEAKNLLTQLQGMKAQLPPEMQKKIDDLATKLAAQAGLAGSGIKIPGGR